MSYIAKPVTVEAFRWMGGPRESWPVWAQRRLDPVNHNNRLWFSSAAWCGEFVQRGDWVVYDQWGGIAKVSPDLFAQLYEELPAKHEDEPQFAFAS